MILFNNAFWVMDTFSCSFNPYPIYSFISFNIAILALIFFYKHILWKQFYFYICIEELEHALPQIDFLRIPYFILFSKGLKILLALLSIQYFILNFCFLLLCLLDIIPRYLKSLNLFVSPLIIMLWWNHPFLSNLRNFTFIQFKHLSHENFTKIVYHFAWLIISFIL